VSETDISGDTSGTYGGSYSDDTVGDTSGTYSGSGYSQDDMDLGTGRTTGRTNISNVGLNSNLTYSPAFATEVAIGRGLDPRGLKGFDTLPSNLSFPSLPGNPSLAGLGYNPSISMNPIAQIDPTSARGQKYSQALALAPNMMGPFSKDALQGLTLADIDKMDPAGIASLMAAADISRSNPYGTTTDQLGYTGSIASMLGLAKGPQDIDYNMSLKDAIETARSGLAYGTVPGQDINNFGQISGISDQFSKDISNISMDQIGKDFSVAGKGIANVASSAFNEVTQAVQDALGFAKDPAGGFTDKDFSDMMGSRSDQQISDMSQQGATMDDTNPSIDLSNVSIEQAPSVGPSYDAFGNVARDADMSRFSDTFGQIGADMSRGLGSLSPQGYY
jgi:hypothetical protein